MKHDEHEMMIEYSEMTSFDFNSKEFKDVQKDYLECKNFVSNVVWSLRTLVNNLRFAKNY